MKIQSGSEQIEVKEVPHWPMYVISRCGRVFLERSGTWCELRQRQRRRTNRYLCVTLGGALQDVHRLVLMAWEGQPTSERPWALHKDGDPTNNHLSNLYWGTPKENAADRTRHGRTLRGELHPCSKLRRSEVAAMRLRALAGEKVSELASAYGVSATTVWRAVRGVSWAHVPGAVNDNREVGLQSRACAANDDQEQGYRACAANDDQERAEQAKNDDRELSGAEASKGGADD